MKTTVVLALFVVAVFCVAAAQAELKLTGSGAAMEADISGYPPNMKSIYPVFKAKCAKCHGLDRTLTTLQTGIAPSGAVFDKAAIDAYGAKMLRKPDAEMTKAEVKSILELMHFMADEAAK